MPDDVDNITLEHLTEKAIGGDKEALTSLMQHPKFVQLLDDVSAWAARKYNQDKEDIREVILIMIYTRIKTLQDPPRLKEWCYHITKHYCLNEIRHRKVESAYQEIIRNQSQEDKRWGGKPLVQSEPISTQEQELLTKEQELIINEVLRRATESFPNWLVEGWAVGKSPKEIAEASGKPVKTIYRMLKQMQKAIIEDSLSEVETRRSRIQLSQSEIESEKRITRSILDELRNK